MALPPLKLIESVLFLLDRLRKVFDTFRASFFFRGGLVKTLFPPNIFFV